MSKQNFKKTIEELVAKFERNVDHYKDQSSSFNETQLRIEFIDPMFEAFGWDMNKPITYTVWELHSQIA